MTIGIDARMYGAKQTGIGNYIRNLTDCLFALDQKNRYIIFLLEPEFSSYEPPSSRVSKVKVKASWYTFSEQFSLPRDLNRYSVDLMHFPHFNAPVLYRKKYILTVHDITQKYFPGLDFLSALLRKQAYELIFAHNVNYAKKVISVSRYTKNDILKNFSVDADKIQVIYEGIDSRFTPLEKIHPLRNKFLTGFSEKGRKEAAATLKNKYNLDSPFILYVGVLREHKNVVGLIYAFNSLLQRYHLDCKLVLVGNPDPRYPKIQETIQKLKLNKRIVQVGFVPEEELVSFYQAASVLVLPSFREGFGFTPLEAMASGTPVASSKSTSLPEILGGAALYFDPYKIPEMAAAILKILNNRALKDDLIKKGRERIKMFSWEKCARETLDLYNTVLDES
ncbi:MAG: glycosyltransferase family 1 protein [Patescibacteria group bacterium]|nr:glycosyltransferase family 1 protein [Patescibacteria group bacterium]